MQPETKFAWLGPDRIAYQVLGDGPPDLVVSFGFFGQVDIAWEDPGLALFFRTLASFSRLILFDRRGSGASDPVVLDSLPPWEAYVEDLEAVLDQVGSERAAIMAHVDGGAMALLFAATRPERTSALVLVNCSAKSRAAEDYPIGIPLEVAQGQMAQVDQLWGTDALVQTWAASRAGDQRFGRWATKYQRAIASPRTFRAFTSTLLELDSRPILPLVQAPTLVIAKQGFQLIPVEQSRFLAEHIPHAKLVELPGTDALLAWETPEVALDLIEQFLAGVRRPAEATRVLATLLFTDIVGSTDRARQLGDRRWHQVLTVHDELTRRDSRGVPRPTRRDHWRRHTGHLRWPRPGDPLRGRYQGRAGRHRPADPGRAAHWRDRTARERCGRDRSAHRSPGDGHGGARGDSYLPDGPRFGGRLRHRHGRPGYTSAEGRRR